MKPGLKVLNETRDKNLIEINKWAIIIRIN